MVSESSYQAHLKTYSLVLINDKKLFEENILPKLYSLAGNNPSAWYAHALEFPRPPWAPQHINMLLTDLGYAQIAFVEDEVDYSEYGYPSWLQP